MRQMKRDHSTTSNTAGRSPERPNQEPRRFNVHPDYDSETREHRRKKGIDGTQYDDDVRNVFWSAIVETYLNPYKDYLAAKRITLMQIAERLQLASTTGWRWELWAHPEEHNQAKSTPAVPNLENFFLGLAAFNINIHDISFPLGRDAVVIGAMKAIGFIHNGKSPAADAPSLTREQFECLHVVFQTLEWGKSRNDRPRLRKLAHDVAK